MSTRTSTDGTPVDVRTAARRLPATPVAAAGAGVLALALLAAVGVARTPATVATTALAPPPPVAAPADPAAAVAAPELADSLVAEVERELDLASELEIPTIADDARDLTAFRSAQVPEDASGAVVPADLLVTAPDGETFDLEELDDVLGAARHVAAAARITGELAAALGDEDVAADVTLLGVDPTSFRPLTPEVTATVDAVWDRLAEGEALVQHEVARELGVDLGDHLLLTTSDGVTRTLRVGALAANGTPPIADVLVSTRVARDLGHAAPDTLVVAVDGDLDPLADALGEATDGEVEVRRPAPEPVGPKRTGPSPSGAIEPFSYTSRADGRIDIHGDWVARNIVTVKLPGMATTRCHRVMVPQLLGAVEELIERGLYGHLDPSQFAGCFVARHIDWNPAKPLSQHAWGLAIDFNSRDNPLGARPVMDPDVVAVFRRWGFSWGGDWRRPDGMHFELERIVSSG